MNFVAHDCRGTRDGSCNNRFVAEDITGAVNQIPTWRWCPECCKKLGIDYDKQKPSDYRTDEQNEKIREKQEKLKEIRLNKKQNIKS